MDKYNPEELNAAIEKAVKKGFKGKGMYDCLMFIPEKKMNEQGYVDAKRFGYNNDSEELDFLGYIDVMPWDIDYKEDYRMDFISGGINLFRKDGLKFKVSGMTYCDTVIG